MTKSGAITLVVLSTLFYICGGICVFKTTMLVTWARRNYDKSKLVQAYPFSNLVTKPWYPAYIRGAGVFIWFWALAVDYLVLFRGFH